MFARAARPTILVLRGGARAATTRGGERIASTMTALGWRRSSTAASDSVDVEGHDDAPYEPNVDSSVDVSGAHWTQDGEGAAGADASNPLPPLSSLLREFAQEQVKDAVVVDTAQAEAERLRAAKTVDAKGRAYATGRRKKSVARVWLRPRSEESAPDAAPSLTVNKKPLADYFPEVKQSAHVLEPLLLVGAMGTVDLSCTVKGGGLSGQAGAVRLGIARALETLDPEHRKPLKAAGLLTRDPRMVERKKAGQKKARKKFQWVKR